MALLTVNIDDGSAVHDSTLIEQGALHVIADISSALDVVDSVIATRGREYDRSATDSVAVTDALVLGNVVHPVAGDVVDVTDSTRIQMVHRVTVSDAVLVNDNVVRQPILALLISQARALTESKVRIDFSAPMLINEALRRPTSYVFHNVSPGGVEVVPLSVTVPAGQLNPLYVELDTTEHTNEATYSVALSSALRGAAEETSNGVPFEYVGIGVKPTLKLVLATSATEVDVYFSEPVLNNAAANDRTKYQWAGGISTVDVKRVVGNVVTLQTTAQMPGALYTLTVVGSTNFVRELDTNNISVVDSLLAVVFNNIVIPPVGDLAVLTDVIKVTRTRTRAATDSIVVADDINAETGVGDDDMNFAGIVTTTTTVANNTRQGFNASGGTLTLNAPASPSTGTQWAIVETAGSSAVITVSGNGHNIWSPVSESFVSSFTIGMAGLALQWVYNGSTWSLI